MEIKRYKESEEAIDSGCEALSTLFKINREKPVFLCLRAGDARNEKSEQVIGVWECYLSLSALSLN